MKVLPYIFIQLTFLMLFSCKFKSASTPTSAADANLSLQDENATQKPNTQQGFYLATSEDLKAIFDKYEENRSQYVSPFSELNSELDFIAELAEYVEGQNAQQLALALQGNDFLGVVRTEKSGVDLQLVGDISKSGEKQIEILKKLMAHDKRIELMIGEFMLSRRVLAHDIRNLYQPKTSAAELKYAIEFTYPDPANAEGKAERVHMLPSEINQTEKLMLEIEEIVKSKKGKLSPEDLANLRQRVNALPDGYNMNRPGGEPLFKVELEVALDADGTTYEQISEHLVVDKNGGSFLDTFLHASNVPSFEQKEKAEREFVSSTEYVKHAASYEQKLKALNAEVVSARSSAKRPAAAVAPTEVKGMGSRNKIVTSFDSPSGSSDGSPTEKRKVSWGSPESSVSDGSPGSGGSKATTRSRASAGSRGSRAATSLSEAARVRSRQAPIARTDRWGNPLKPLPRPGSGRSQVGVPTREVKTSTRFSAREALLIDSPSSAPIDPQSVLLQDLEDFRTKIFSQELPSN